MAFFKLKNNKILGEKGLKIDAAFMRAKIEFEIKIDFIKAKNFFVILSKILYNLINHF